MNNKKDGKPKMYPMTRILDTVSCYCWFDVLAPIRCNPNSYECNHMFDGVWLSRYPRPQLVGLDGSSEFKLHFNELCDNFGITPHSWGLEPTNQYHTGAHAPSTKRLLKHF